MARPRIHFEAAKAQLEEHGEMRAGDIAERLGISPGTLASAMRVPERDGEILRRHEGRQAFYKLPEDEGEEGPEEFNAAAWADGDVDLYGIIPLDDGGFRLTPEMVTKLKRVITWMPTP
jgi:DNA-binding transcriptional ArsR family regulator